MSAFAQDLRYAIRTLRHQPGVTITAVLTVALGISSTTVVFSVVHAVLIRPLPYPDSDRLVMMLSEARDQGRVDRFPAVFPGDFLEWDAQSRALEAIAAAAGGTVNLASAGEPIRLQRATVTRRFFDVLGVAPVSGRTFSREEERSGGPPVAIISGSLWERRFHSDPSIVGRTIVLDRVPVTVVGVMPAALAFPAHAEIWTPLWLTPGDRDNSYLQVIGRLAPGISLAQAQAEMTTIQARVEAHAARKRGIGVALVPLKEQVIGDVRPLLLVFSGAVVLVLLIACANVANLLLARAAARRAEVGVRVALGATRWRLGRQYLSESLVLGAIGGAGGLLLSSWGVDLLVAVIPAGSVPRLAETTIDPAVMAFAVAVSLGTSLLFGIAPVVQAVRSTPRDVLAEAGGRGQVPGLGGLRGLVASEVALAIVLLVGAVLLTRSFVRLATVDLGFNPDHVLIADVNLPAGEDDPIDRMVAFHDRALGRIARLPGVAAAGVVDWLPLGGMLIRGDFPVEGRSSWPEGLMAAKLSISPGYFQAIGIRTIRGRTFTSSDDRGSPGVAIVSESLARRLWPGQDPLAHRVKIGIGNSAQEGWRTVVGVVGDVRQSTLAEGPLPSLYTPIAQAPVSFLVSDVTYVVRASGEPMTLAAAVTREIHALDPALPVSRVQPLTAVLDDALASPRFRMVLLATFAVLGVVLASVGIFGVLAYSVSRRTREIGVRMALGADRDRLVRLVVRQALTMTLSGLVAGVCAALALTRVLRSFLFEVTPGDPLAFVTTSLVVIAVALVASYAPARRATRVDPVTALRSE
jgi:putative ABC transport system permease protein